MRNNGFVLKDCGGIPDRLLYTLAVIAGVSVANLYYNQPLLEMLRADLHTSSLQANHIALFAQVGYALGLLFIIPLGDLFSRKRIILVNFSIITVSQLCIALASNIRIVQLFSFITGICAVIPHLFIPFAAQYSRPERKDRNVGIVLSGLLTGILGSRVVSGAVGDMLGWREMYFIAAGMMTVAILVVWCVVPNATPNFTGSYGQLMGSLVTFVRKYPMLRLHSVRAALAFGSFMCFWASLAFKMAQAPFYAGSDVVGVLGLCGIAGALTASVAGKYIRTVGVRRFNYFGTILQMLAWVSFFAGSGYYATIVLGIILIDVGMQSIQLSNQAPLFDISPSASSRINTIFMSIYFAGGALGTFLSGWAWTMWGWSGVSACGILLAFAAFMVTVCCRE